MKSVLRLIMIVGVLLANIQVMSAGMPEIHIDKSVLINGKKHKVAYTDFFTTNINGENVEMRIAYSIPVKKILL